MLTPFFPKIIGVFFLFLSVFLPFYYKEQFSSTLNSSALLDLPLWQILATFSWLFGGWFCLLCINRVLIDFWLRRWHPKVAPALARSLFFVLSVLVVLSGILSTVFHQPITGLWAMSGGISLILGIALQSIIADFFAGIILNAEGTFKVGDHIQINNRRLTSAALLRGRVVDINWHSTRIRTPEGDLLIFPNNLFNTTVLTNLSAPGAERAFEVVFFFDAKESLERVSRVLEAAALSTQELLRLPLPKVLVGNSKDLQQEYRIEVWFVQGKVREKDARSALMTNAHHHIQHSGIALAAPAMQPFFPSSTEGISASASSEKTHWEQKIHQLKNTEVFSILNRAELEVTSTNLIERLFQKGDVVVQQGAAGDSMFLIIEGLVQVRINTKETAESNLMLAELQPGKCFGEMSLFSGEARIADVECMTSCLLFEITQETLQYLLKQSPALSHKLVEIIAQRQSDVITQKTRNLEELQRLRQQVVQTTFCKIRNYFSHFMDGFFLIGHQADESLSAINVSHMGLLAARTGIKTHQELALNSVILGVGLPRPPSFNETTKTQI